MTLADLSVIGAGFLMNDAILIPLFVALWFLPALSYAALAALIAASVWNIIAQRQYRTVAPA